MCISKNFIRGEGRRGPPTILKTDIVRREREKEKEGPYKILRGKSACHVIFPRGIKRIGIWAFTFSEIHIKVIRFPICEIESSGATDINVLNGTCGMHIYLYVNTLSQEETQV